MEKFEQAKKLNDEIEELESFLSLAEQKEQECFPSLILNKRVVDSPFPNHVLNEAISNSKVIEELMDICIPFIKANITSKKSELEALFK